MPDIFETIMHRRSIRRFEPKQLEEAALQQIIQAGLYAPSAGGRQGVIFAVCQDKEVNERLGKIKRANSNPRMATATSFVSREQPSIADDPKLTNAFYDAPTVITMFAPKNFLFSVDDCAVAAENMMLAAHSMGLGTVWINQLKDTCGDAGVRKLLTAFGVPEDHDVYACCAIGTALGGAKAPDRKAGATAIVE